MKKILSWIWFPALLLAFFGITAYFVWRGKQPTRRGLEIKKEMYDSVPVFSHLDTTAQRALPVQVSLEAFCPTRQNQGDQNSCVGWSIAYAARTIIEAKATGSNPNSVAFSPAFLFNQIRLFGCTGSYMPQAFRQVTDKGLVSFDEFPYSDADCDKQPTTEQLQRAERYKIAGFSRLTKSKTDFTLDTLGMKQCLAGGTPVVIGAIITASFDSLNTKIWIPPTTADESLGGHAMCVVGYNDTLAGGAFQIMNSWGETWGDRGFGWVRYTDFMTFCKEAYSLQPLPTTEKQHELHFKLRWTAQNNEYNINLTSKNKQFLPALIAKRNKNGTPKSAIPNLQLEAENNSNFYFYLIGQRKNSTKAQVIFPVDKQETAYLGIFGKRLFPREKPLNVNFRQTAFEQIVALHSKFPLAIDSVCASVNTLRNRNLTARLTAILGDKIFPNLTTKIVKNALVINTDSSDRSIALVPFFMPTEPLLPIPTLKNALKKPIDSLVVRCANIKIGRKNVSFDITARTSNHPDWNGYLNNLDVVLVTDANIVGYDDLAARTKAAVGTTFAQAKYGVNLTDLERGTMLIRLSPKTKLRTFLERKTKTLARITIPIENCSPDLNQTGLRLSLMQSGGSATATYGITPENNTNTKLKFRKFGFRDVVVKMRCQ